MLILLINIRTFIQYIYIYIYIYIYLCIIVRIYVILLMWIYIRSINFFTIYLKYTIMMVYKL